MPKFVSGSSGHIYSHDTNNDEEDEISKFTKPNADNQKSLAGSKKPSAVNKKGIKEQQKSSLDIFKEELRRLNEERNEQRDRLKKSLESNNNTSINDSTKTTQQPSKAPQLQPQICIPLKPDPRCPTTLTLQVNLNPKDKDATSMGSFDTGDPTTTNLYLGNLNPTVNENDLCDIFGKFGPLASIKVMWPRTDEERARNRNSGFVAYMSRIDAERALKTLNGMDIRGYDVKLGWGKAVPLPQNPVYIPPELIKLLEPPPHTGLPFNGQLHETDLRQKYKVPHPAPKPLSPDELSLVASGNTELKALRDTYDEFIAVHNQSTIRVVIPQDRKLLDKIHKTIEFVIQEGPVFEAIIIAREQENTDYKFLYNNHCYEHVYYRWKLYSILHGDDPYKWQTDEFRMFQGGPLWKPPPLNPFADGMPVELIEKSTGVSRDLLLKDGSLIHDSHQQSRIGLDVKSTVRLHLNLSDTRQKGSLGPIKRPQLQTILDRLVPTKNSIGIAMMFCINHSDAAQEVIDCIDESSRRENLPLINKIAHIFLVSDVLHNCSAAVTNASYYRRGFQTKLDLIFNDLRNYLVATDQPKLVAQGQQEGQNNALQRQKSDQFKQKILGILGAWREWTLYEDEFIIRLSDILLGIDSSKKTDQPRDQKSEEAKLDDANEGSLNKVVLEDNLDGDQLEEETLIKCLEAKGLSLRWYKTLDLSEDEQEDEAGCKDEIAEKPCKRIKRSRHETVGRDGKSPNVEAETGQVRFKASKWETVDPNEVAEQVARLSKWEAIERAAQEAAAASGSSTSFEGDDEYETVRRSKRHPEELHRRTGTPSSSISSNSLSSPH